MSTLKKSSERKKQVENQATKLFESRGFAATSMRNLATELQIEAASLYSHIKSKDELLRSICFTMADVFFEAVSATSETTPTAIEKLKTSVHAHVKVITENTSAAAVFFSEWRHLTEPSLSAFLAMRNDYENIFLKIIQEGVEKKELNVNDPKFAVRLLFNSMNWLHTWYKPEGAMRPEEISAKICDIIIYGMGTKSLRQVK